MEYRCEVRTTKGLVQQLVTNYVSRGYFYYVTGKLPERKNPHEFDAKMIAKYKLSRRKVDRLARKEAGQANVGYLRLGRYFVLMATGPMGAHRFFNPCDAARGQDGESTLDAAGNERRILDVRRTPLKVGGYSVAFVNGHGRVQIHQEEYCRQKRAAVELAKQASADELREWFQDFPYEPYWKIREQLFAMLRAVNAARKTAGLSQLPEDVLRLKRHKVKVFDAPSPERWRREEEKQRRLERERKAA